MNLSGGKLLAGPIACALVVVMAAGCSSSSKGDTFPTTPQGSTVTTLPISQTVGKALPDTPACSLATAAQVKALLGVAATPQEVPGRPAAAPTSKACTWTGAGGQVFSISIIRLGKGQLGFTYARIQGLTSSVVAGLGSRAVYLSGLASGLNQSILAADQGSISLSLSVGWKGTLPKSETLKDNLTTLIRSVFTQLGA